MRIAAFLEKVGGAPYFTFTQQPGLQPRAIQTLLLLTLILLKKEEKIGLQTTEGRSIKSVYVYTHTKEKSNHRLLNTARRIKHLTSVIKEKEIQK